jgi:hypothetical protein
MENTPHSAESATPSRPSISEFSVFGRRRGKFFMKLFFYEGLAVFLPYCLISSLTHPDFSSNNLQTYFILLFGAFSLLGLFIMDFIGFQYRIIDRMTRGFTKILAIFGLVGSILLIVFSWNGWNPYNWGITAGIILTLVAFEGFGWYFIRANRAIQLKKEPPYFRSTVYALALCGIGFFLEFFIPLSILFGLAISFLLFLIIMRYELVNVVPKVKERNLIKPFRRVTIWNFLIDFIKLIGIIITIVSLSYNGKIVLFPLPISNLWIFHLCLVCMAASITMIFIHHNNQKLYGLIVILIMFSANLIMFILIRFVVNTPSAIIAILNGISIAGLYYFIEQKMDQSPNVRAMPGSFYILVLFLFLMSIILRHEPTADMVLEIAAPVVSILGIAYILGYVRDRPKTSHVVYWEPIVGKE